MELFGQQTICYSDANNSLGHGLNIGPFDDWTVFNHLDIRYSYPHCVHIIWAHCNRYHETLKFDLK